MPEKPKTKGFDYSRRMYVSNLPYTEQSRKFSDSHRDGKAKQPHSEDKKPYLDDDYPEMEYFNTPWQPNIPFFPNPPTFPTVPVDPGGPGPTNDPWEDVPTPRDNRFLGCMFIPGFSPKQLNPGETAFAKLARRDDPVIGFTVHGPGTIISKSNALCTAAGQELMRQQGTARPGGGSSPECTVILRAWLTGWEQFAAQGGTIPIVVIAHTESGSSCSTELELKTCPPPVELEWDWNSSGQVITGASTTTVYVTGGQLPIDWSISGTGFSIVGTPSGRSATIQKTENACGSATITATDACDNQVTGSVRSSLGSWQQYGTTEEEYHSCILLGHHADFLNNFGNQVQWQNIKGKYKQLEQTSVTQGLSGGCQLGAIHCGQYGEFSPCDDLCGGSDPNYGHGCDDCLYPVGSPNILGEGATLFWVTNRCDISYQQIDCSGVPTYVYRECYGVQFFQAYEWKCQ